MNESSYDNLQADLDLLTAWEKTWQMQFNADKCEVISITGKKPIIQLFYGHELKHVNKDKYLGITITQDRKWNKHINNVVSKATNSQFVEAQLESRQLAHQAAGL